MEKKKGRLVKSRTENFSNAGSGKVISRDKRNHSSCTISFKAFRRKQGYRYSAQTDCILHFVIILTKVNAILAKLCPPKAWTEKLHFFFTYRNAV